MPIGRPYATTGTCRARAAVIVSITDLSVSFNVTTGTSVRMTAATGVDSGSGPPRKRPRVGEVAAGAGGAYNGREGR